MSAWVSTARATAVLTLATTPSRCVIDGGASLMYVVKSRRTFDGSEL
jgi:hypothetical protein